MSRIQVLSETVASRIAAGEVVTGPMSVVKELVENAIDAGATAITVEISNGGRDSIRVTDNGSGIPTDDVGLAIQKHATSKIAAFEDLDSISTLGFRGEALYSIAAISRFTLSTRTRDSISGTVLKVNGGAGMSVLPAGLPEGTTVKVEQLFYNVPARRKFLVSTRNEAAKVGNLMAKLILSKPELSIKYINNGKVIYQSAGNGKLMDALITVYGHEIADKVQPVSTERDGIAVDGYISTPSHLQKNANQITFFVNGRYIQSKLLHDALVAGYGERVMKSHHPFAVLNIAMPYHLVDVNVHPNKTQVLFSQDAPVQEAIQQAVAAALGKNMPHVMELHTPAPAEVEENETVENIETLEDSAEMPEATHSGPLAEDDAAMETGELELEMPVLNSAEQLYKKKQEYAAYPTPGVMPEEIATDRFEHIMDEIIEQAQQIQVEEQTEIQDVRKLVDYTIIGQAFATYLLVECADALYVIDQHAAHERMTYEAMKKSIEEGNAMSQQLLTPYIKKFNQTEFDLIEANIEVLTSLGFELEEFGPLTFKFSALPMQMDQSGAELLADEVLYEIKNNPKDVLLMRDKVIQAACKHSIKAGYKLEQDQIGALMREITEMDAIPNCPHGRPIAIVITKNELQKNFKRTV